MLKVTGLATIGSAANSSTFSPGATRNPRIARSPASDADSTRGDDPRAVMLGCDGFPDHDRGSQENVRSPRLYSIAKETTTAWKTRDTIVGRRAHARGIQAGTAGMSWARKTGYRPDCCGNVL